MSAGSTYFSRLNEAERHSRLWQIAQARVEMLLWEKGAKQRAQGIASAYFREENELVLEQKTSAPKIGTELLGSFQHNGMHFFFKAKLIAAKENSWRLEFAEELFKSERRQNFRLLTFPLYNIHVQFRVSGRYAGSNVVDMKTKVSQTGVFRSFLKLVDEDETSQEKDNQVSLLKIRIQDLSVSGLAIHIGEAELPFFKAGEIIPTAEILFSDDTIVIPRLKVVYVINAISSKEKKNKLYKVGMTFEGMTRLLDDQLGRKINHLLRENDIDKDFEDYIT